jgi:hypothetical protein
MSDSWRSRCMCPAIAGMFGTTGEEVRAETITTRYEHVRAFRRPDPYEWIPFGATKETPDANA